MPNPPTQIDLLRASHQPKTVIPTSPPRRRRILFVAMLFLLLGGVFFLGGVVIPGTRLVNNFGSSNIFAQLTRLTFSGNRGLSGEADGRVNVLLLGIGGAGHEAPLLADTIIIASLAPDTKEIALFSLPRDLLVPYPDGSWRKVNEIYATAERRNPGNGLAAAAATLEPVLGISIPYRVLVDFSGFAKLIDSVGGVDVQVERTFTDPRFPVIGEDKNPNYDARFVSATFKAGWQHMSGDQALMYARSRHGNNGEGSDFARAKRQQKLLIALKNRVMQAGVLLNPITVNRLSNELANHLQTNVEPWQALRLYQSSKDVASDTIIRITIDDRPGGELVSDYTADGAYVLRPRDGTFSLIQSIAANIFKKEPTQDSRSTVSILNGTTISGLANRTAERLIAENFAVTHVGNAAQRTAETTTIYDYSNGARHTALKKLQGIFIGAAIVPVVPTWLQAGAASVAPDLPTNTAPDGDSNTDFVITIGTDWAARGEAATLTP